MFDAPMIASGLQVGTSTLGSDDISTACRSVTPPHRQPVSLAGLKI
jgi:hypothetical protein